MNENALLYLKNLYAKWENPAKRHLEWNLPTTYNTDCPPIPWIGSLDKELIVISLEPLLTTSFDFQCNIAQKDFNQWFNLYFTSEHWKFMYSENKFSTKYWKRLSRFIKGLVNAEFEADWINILGTSIVELPFIQYHASNHSGFQLNDNIIKDLEYRLSFIENKSNKTAIIYGKTKWKFIKDIFKVNDNPKKHDGIEIYDSEIFKTLILIPQNSPSKNYSDQTLYDMGKYCRSLTPPIQQ